MKKKSRITGIAGLVGIAVLGPAFAIEKPAEADGPKEKANAPAVENAPKPAQKAAKNPAAMLGIGGMAASETLSMHLGVEAGDALTIYHIVPGSAAEKAGLEKHDVLTEFDGKKIGNQQDLRDAILVKKPGDEVNVKFYHRGKLREKNIVLGERKEMPHGAEPMPGINPEWLRRNLGEDMPQVMPMNKEFMKHFEKLQKELQQQGGGDMRLDLGDLLKDAQKGGKGGGAFKFGGKTSITLMDAEGSITMNTKNGKKSIIVKNKAGKVQFDGPYDTEQDKAAVPEDFRERIERLGLNEGDGNRMKLRILPMGPIPPVEEDPAE